MRARQLLLIGPPRFFYRIDGSFFGLLYVLTCRVGGLYYIRVQDAGPGTWRVGHAHRDMYMGAGGRRSYCSNGEGGAFGLNMQLPNLAVIKL